jgi:hypothetical protein
MRSLAALSFRLVGVVGHSRRHLRALRIIGMQFPALCAPGFFSAEAGTRAAPFPALLFFR